jgi:hypothetical protein
MEQNETHPRSPDVVRASTDASWAATRPQARVVRKRIVKTRVRLAFIASLLNLERRQEKSFRLSTYVLPA